MLLSPFGTCQSLGPSCGGIWAVRALLGLQTRVGFCSRALLTFVLLSKCQILLSFRKHESKFQMSWGKSGEENVAKSVQAVGQRWWKGTAVH